MPNEAIILTQLYHSPCGDLKLGSFENRLCLCDWLFKPDRHRVITRRLGKNLQAVFQEGESEIITQAVRQLDEYFAGMRTNFDLPLLPVGTKFQQSVWQALSTIPYGKTMSYAALSEQLGNPRAIRAVAAANGANALSVFLPCHRIVGSNHALIDYAGGLPAKKYLLELESSISHGYNQASSSLMASTY